MSNDCAGMIAGVDASERRDIEHDCQQLVVRFAHCLDHGHAQQAALLFTSDGTWNWNGELFQGRAAIHAKCVRRPAQVTRHIASNIHIAVDDQDHATGVSYFLYYHFKGENEFPTLPVQLPPVYSMGEWHDVYVRTAEGWRLAHRSTVRIFHNLRKSGD